ncbi:MAG: VWA domain-containing protein [bacterium]|nr:VWA domain-containing protein [bacterium]
MATVAVLAGACSTSKGGGWIDGEPDWYHDEVSDAAVAEEAMVEAEMAEDAADIAVEETAAAEAPSPTAAPATTIGSGDEPAPEADIAPESEQPQTRLTGGSIDDNERFEDYLAYRAEFFGLGVPVRDLDPAGRIVVTVTGENGLPAAGAEVVVTGDGVEVILRTTADGTVRFHPDAYGDGAGPFTVSAGGVSTTAGRGEIVTLETSLPTASGETVALDVLFLLDATGSMADEIHQLKITIDEVAQRIHQLPGDVDVRLGMTLYRDEFDSFLTSTFDLTPEIEAFSEALSVVVADGGDDYPEALDEALAEALSRPSWRSASETVQLIFLVADAPPQVLRQVPVPYTDSMREAARRGIKVFPVSSSGTDDQAEFVFRQLAQFTGARYVFLTYGAEGRATGPASDIDELDYEELSLDDLIVRLVAEELAALTAAPDDESGSEAPTTTQDDQQGN